MLGLRKPYSTTKNILKNLTIIVPTTVKGDHLRFLTSILLQNIKIAKPFGDSKKFLKNKEF